MFLAFRLQPSTLSHARSRYADEKGAHPAPRAFLSTVVREGCRPLVLLGGASLLLFCKPVGIPLSRVGVGGIFKSPPPGAVFLGILPIREDMTVAVLYSSGDVGRLVLHGLES